MPRSEFVVTSAAAPREFIALCVPTFGQVHIYWASKLFGERRDPMNRDVRNFVCIGKEVGAARNELVQKVLEHEERTGRRCSHVFFVDDDVIIHPEVLVKLLEADRDIVSGLYYAKTAVAQPLVLMEDGLSRSWVPGELVDCWAHGMGITLIRTDVFRRLRDETPLGVDDYGMPGWFKTVREVELYGANGHTVVRNQTEDISFLRKAAALGYQPCVDTSAQAFGWHWAAGEHRAYPLKQWVEFQQKGTITWETDAGPVVWGR